MNAPMWVNDPSALVIVDWSWWLNTAFRIATDGDFAPIVVGWLCDLLGWQPAHLAIAVDSQGPTFRHQMQHPTNPEWRYKGNRPPKPKEFYDTSRELTRIVQYYRIPTLWAEGYEADDVIATLTSKAYRAGMRVFILSVDKDIASLVRDDRSGPAVRTWNGRDHDQFVGPKEVVSKFGVEPAQIPDLLAIAGDSGDCVPGVDGIGHDKAAKILGSYGTLHNALQTPTWTTEERETTEKDIKALAKQIKKTTDDRERAALTSIRSETMARASLERWRQTLQEQRALADFSRELTGLHHDAPITLDPSMLAVGGFVTENLRASYNRLGFTQKAAEVNAYPKRETYGVWA